MKIDLERINDNLNTDIKYKRCNGSSFALCFKIATSLICETNQKINLVSQNNVSSKRHINLIEFILQQLSGDNKKIHLEKINNSVYKFCGNKILLISAKENNREKFSYKEDYIYVE